MDSNDALQSCNTVDSSASSVADEIKQQMRDSLQLYRWWQRECEDAMRHGVTPSKRMILSRSNAMREYLECVRTLATTESNAASAPNESSVQVDLDADAYRLLPADTLLQMVQDVESKLKDLGNE